MPDLECADNLDNISLSSSVFSFVARELANVPVEVPSDSKLSVRE